MIVIAQISGVNKHNNCIQLLLYSRVHNDIQILFNCFVSSTYTGTRRCSITHYDRVLREHGLHEDEKAETKRVISNNKIKWAVCLDLTSTKGAQNSQNGEIASKN